MRIRISWILITTEKVMLVKLPQLLMLERINLNVKFIRTRLEMLFH